MLKYLYFIAALILGFLTKNLFGSEAILAQLVCYTIAIYLLFFCRRQVLTNSFLLGLTIVFEIFSPVRLGMATLLGTILLFLQQVLSENIKITTRYLRFVAALLIGLILVVILLYPLENLSWRLRYCLLAWPIMALLSYPPSSWQREQTYQFLEV